MATCDGAAHLAAQLDSLAAQDDPHWRLWVSDDGSTDATREIVRDFAARVGQKTGQKTGQQVRLLEGPRRGTAAANFLGLLHRPDLPRGLVALCDQDDLWYSDKLARARAAMTGPEGESEDRPVLYGAEADLIDDAGRIIGRTRPPLRGPSFANALVQNAVAGHSAVLNDAALACLRGAGEVPDAPPDAPHHDWWLYQVISGAGGRVILDPARVLGYRQHRGNAMGMARADKVRRLWHGEWAGWTGAHLASLTRIEDRLTPANRALLHAFADGRARPGPLERWRGVAATGVHRQERGGTTLVRALAALRLI